MRYICLTKRRMLECLDVWMLDLSISDVKIWDLWIWNHKACVVGVLNLWGFRFRNLDCLSSAWLDCLTAGRLDFEFPTSHPLEWVTSGGCNFGIVGIVDLLVLWYVCFLAFEPCICNIEVLCSGYYDLATFEFQAWDVWSCGFVDLCFCGFYIIRSFVPGFQDCGLEGLAFLNVWISRCLTSWMLNSWVLGFWICRILSLWVWDFSDFDFWTLDLGCWGSCSKLWFSGHWISGVWS